jgi:uncharacterized membrane protein YphA (DoxX/SURF4 family)
MDALLLVARLVLAAVFLVSGISKLFDLPGSQTAMRSFGVPESMARQGGILLPIVELVIACSSSRPGRLAGAPCLRWFC